MPKIKKIIVHTFIVNEKAKVLTIRRAADEDVLPGIWDIPGGTLLPGEDPQEGAIREVLVPISNLFHTPLFPIKPSRKPKPSSVDWH
jgi:8-oxo-dGTP diphosphatase